MLLLFQFFFEAAIVTVILMFISEEHARDYSKAVLVVFGIVVLNVIIAVLLGASLGYFILIPMAIVYFLGLGIFFGLSSNQAFLVVGILFAIKYGLPFLFPWISSLFFFPISG